MLQVCSKFCALIRAYWLAEWVKRDDQDENDQADAEKNREAVSHVLALRLSDRDRLRPSSVASQATASSAPSPAERSALLPASPARSSSWPSPAAGRPSSDACAASASSAGSQAEPDPSCAASTAAPRSRDRRRAPPPEWRQRQRRQERRAATAWASQPTGSGSRSVAGSSAFDCDCRPSSASIFSARRACSAFISASELAPVSVSLLSFCFMPPLIPRPMKTIIKPIPIGQASRARKSSGLVAPISILCLLFGK